MSDSIMGQKIKRREKSLATNGTFRPDYYLLARDKR